MALWNVRGWDGVRKGATEVTLRNLVASFEGRGTAMISVKGCVSLGTRQVMNASVTACCCLLVA